MELNTYVKFLTVRELHKALQQRGLDISYSSLSELLNCGDIAAQLLINGGGNARRILPETCELLAEFLPIYRARRGRLPQAPDLLRSFLKIREQATLVPVREFGSLPELTSGGTEIATVLKESGGEAVALLRRLVVAIEGQRQAEPVADRWIGALEAMALLHCSRRALGRRVRPVMPETWSYLQIQDYMRKRREREDERHAD